MTRRFPDLKFAFLEGGVGWGCQLFADLIEHWERRGRKGIAEDERFRRSSTAGSSKSLVEKYGYDDMAAELARRDGWPSAEEDNPTGGGTVLDDFAPMRIARKEDLGELFSRFYFGCEADDRMNAVAFQTRINRFGMRLNAIFSSDIGHFDVPDMTRVVEEAWELVEDGAMSAEDFRDTSPSPTPCTYGAPRTRASSKARRWRRKQRRCWTSPRRAPPRNRPHLWTTSRRRD